MRSFLLLITHILLCLSLPGQSTICTGNFGENIFVEGDFGSSLANIRLTDPGIAPGFLYTTSVPPDDGEYTITNNTAAWSYLYPTWLRIGDNSTDPEGYMMVVNASYTPGVFYEQTIVGLCDNTLYEFSADVINMVKQSVPGHIFPNVSFLIDSVTEFTTGPIAQTESWKTFGFTFITKPGQEQVTLTLRNNAPGGIGNDLALDNISFRPCGPSATITIDMEGRVCENTLYPTLSAIIASDTGYVQWQISTDLGMSWTDIPGATNRTYQSIQLSAQNYLFRYLYGKTPQHLLNEKCRIVSASRLLEVVPVHFTIIDSLCAGLSFDLGGIPYDETGVYFEHLTAENGCDSLVTLHLTIVPDPGVTAALVASSPLCTGGVDGLIEVTSVMNGVPPYFITISGQSPSPFDTPIPVPAGHYDIRISDRYGCADLHTVDIQDPDLFVIDIAGENAVVLGHSTTLHVTGNYQINSLQWYPSIALSCTTCTTTQAMPLASTTYTTTAVSENGCMASDTINIYINTNPRLYIPNIFSPNGDQINDTWGIYADPLNIPVIHHVVIFDRWGNVVKEISGTPSLDAHEIWDGNYDSNSLPSGVYTFLLQLLLANEAVVPKAGTITLIR